MNGLNNGVTLMNIDNIIIRNATVDDIPKVAQIHVNSWNRTYKGIIVQ